MSVTSQTRLVLVDLETTGLDVAKHEITEVAALSLDPEQLSILSTYCVKVLPVHIDTADPEALRLTNYSADNWANAVPLVDALEKLYPILHESALLGHNVYFDLLFLRAAYAAHPELPCPQIDYHTIDTASLAYPSVLRGIVRSTSLHDLATDLGIGHGEPHVALNDALLTLDIALKLIEVAKRFAPMMHHPMMHHSTDE